MTQTHSVISPAILYWGTPVVLVSSENEDGTHNLCAISSAFWLGHRCVLGFGAGSKTPQNILRTGQCVVCLPDDAMVGPVNALASTTGSETPSPSKLARGYRFVRDKWSCAGVTPQPADLVRPARVRECPVQMECALASSHPLMEDVPDRRGVLVAVELQVLRVHVRDELRMEGHANRIDPDRWRPMIMSFQELYGLSKGKAGTSDLARIDEEMYRIPMRSSLVKMPVNSEEEMADARHKAARPNGNV
ncbi:hypothetical protein JDV02_008746 [Purpureocillium takamizusanense]|uniref:Flavin reductase like domain-containing protein n=1 Tax=Purpureocillium takamizusanense TaxID=2060973 RepID=A0A9Q8QPC2_9HYPO|nr:uncharacterized protein JDV02_008746 [Purpureocillium takamizusanense]UNI22902.1 hypothetical protein JDV02_008746 [Purpureocillium takamizusanense]